MTSRTRAPGFTRRALLGGGAVVVALPFLESLQPRVARAQVAPAMPRRLIYYYVPNGIHMADFRPTTAGSAYTLPPMLTPLEALKGDFSVITGLENVNAKPDVAGDHASGTSAFITCAKALKSETNISLGISVDQIAAAKIGGTIPSLQLGMQGGASSGGCDSGYGCAYARNISWSSATTPLPKQTDPTKVFDQLFSAGGATSGETEAAAAKRRANNKSVLDTVLQEASSLRLKLGRTDQGKVDQYLNGVRELEKRVSAAAAVSSVECKMPARPVASGNDFPAKLRLMTDLMVLAVQCDRTRVISFMLGNALSGQTFPHLGITSGHHAISHHANSAANLEMLAKIGKWEVEELGYLMTKLKAIPEGEGGTSNALFNSTIFWSSDISDGNRHNHDDMPIILAGHGGGTLGPGRHITFARTAKQKVANLLLTTLKTVGIEGEKLGDGDAPLPDPLKV